jgi:small subunit ribosomal protein S17
MSMSENENPIVDETSSQEAAEVAAAPESDSAAGENADGENAAGESAVSESAAGASATVVVAAAAQGRRQEKIGLVTSNKMTKTVVVRVERQVRHPKYKRYIRRRKKFMAHDELGVNVGDIVRIIETRPLSARKRWRVVEVVQKAS